MEKQLSVIGYWLGLVSTVLALLFRCVAALNMHIPALGAAGGNAISYTTFLRGAVLFFLLAIASWFRTAKSL